MIFDLNTFNHHFKSLAHNPSICGLFFALLDQFCNTSHFVSGGIEIILEKADDSFWLEGATIPEKLFCGFVNWIGHLISDMSGSSGSAGRGMGIPSPLWTWINDIAVIRSQLQIEPSEFDKYLNELAVNIYKKGFDVRFQTAQLIPVFVNELTVRLFYCIRRLVKYLKSTEREEISFGSLWSACEPFSNSSVKRMLTVAHGTFCLLDIADAMARGAIMGGGAAFNVEEFLLRLNIAGIGRFTISLYGETVRGIDNYQNDQKIHFLRREQVIVENYLFGLEQLAKLYDDADLLDFVDDFQNSDMYVQAFAKTIKLAELRKVPEENILRTKTDIDNYFGGKKHE